MTDLINYFNDRLMDAPAEFRRELASYVQEHAAASPTPATTASIDRLIREGRAYLGCDDCIAVQRQRATEERRDAGEARRRHAAARS